MLKTSLIKDYPNYIIDTEGNVTNTTTGKVLKPRQDKNGYVRVRLYKNNVGTNFLVHRIVALHFLPNPNNLPQVNHKDENKLNNCVDNLEWCDIKYNVNYGKGIERRSKSKSKEIVQYNLDGTIVNVWPSATEAARLLNIKRDSIYACCHAKTKTSYGYIWKFNKCA